MGKSLDLDFSKIIHETRARRDFNGIELRANYVDDFHPFCFINTGDNQVKGAFPDTLKVASKVLNFTLKFQTPRAENRNIWSQR